VDTEAIAKSIDDNRDIDRPVLPSHFLRDFRVEPMTVAHGEKSLKHHINKRDDLFHRRGRFCDAGQVEEGERKAELVTRAQE
jgi:hypothetical protein